MANDPWALPASFYSIIVKTPAVERSFPGGRTMFEARFQPARKNGALQMLVAMSAADVDHLLGQLQPLGLVPGEDIAVADMMDGPLLECPGVAFVNVGPAFPAQWMVNADEGPCPQPAGRHETA